MKKRILTMSMLAALSGQLLADDYGYMVFTMSDGTTQSISANGLSLSFSNGSLTAKSGTNTLTISLTNLTKMAFSTENDTAVTEIGELGTLPLDDTAEIYDLRGHQVTKAQMRKGVYIVKTKSRTYKVNVR